MGVLVFTVVLAIIFVGLVVFGLYSKKYKKPGLFSALGVFVLTTVMLFFSSLTTVQANTVGIEQVLGNPVGTLGAGPHFLTPWASVDDFSTQMQTDDLSVDQNQFKFKLGAAGGVELTVNWRVDASQAVRLWRQYSDLQNVQDKLITPRVKKATNEAFSAYLSEDAVGSIPQITQSIAKTLQESLANDGVTIDPQNISVKNFVLSPNAQNRVDSLVGANTDIQKATLEQRKATIDAATNQIRQQSSTPQALANRCLDIVQAWEVSKQGPMPATLNCSNVASSVLVQQAK